MASQLSAIRRQLPVLGEPNVKPLAAATFFNAAGNNIYTVALGWLAYEATGSPLVVGAVLGFRSLPLIFMAFILGECARDAANCLPFDRAFWMDLGGDLVELRNQESHLYRGFATDSPPTAKFLPTVSFGPDSSPRICPGTNPGQIIVINGCLFGRLDICLYFC